jgi:hypothetical protein
MLILILIILLLFLYFNFKSTSHFTKSNDKIAIISVMYKPKNIETWLQIHRDLGISHFYIRLEDTPELIEYLRSQPDVTLEIGTNKNASHQYNSIMDRQLKMANDALKLCKKDRMDFLIQIDCDEILEGDLNEIRQLPKNIDTFWMQNHEAVYDGIPTSSDSCFQAKYFKDCGKRDSGCVSYVNGKGGGRVVPSVSSNGCHRFKGNHEVKLQNVIVKHFESCDFDQYIKKYKNYQKGVVLKDIPFPYYRESILAKDNVEKLKEVYTVYRTDI